MFKKKFFCVFIVSFFFMFYTSHGMTNLRAAKQLDEVENQAGDNETEFLPEITENNMVNNTESGALAWILPETSENKTINATDDNVLNWTSSEKNSTVEAVISQSSDQQIEPEKVDNTSVALAENKNETESVTMSVEMDAPLEVVDQATEQNKYSEEFVQMHDWNEEILLHRNNCHMEIAIHDTQDLKIFIRFDNLQNNSIGECCLTLNTQENSKLGVLLSNIHLYRSSHQGEVLKVIVKSYGSSFILKEYYGDSTYEPFLLTETNRVYLILQYSVGTVTPNEDSSHFKLEAFTYHKYESNIDTYLQLYDDSYYSMHYY